MEMMGNKIDYQCTSVTPKDVHAPKINTFLYREIYLNFRPNPSSGAYTGASNNARSSS